MQKNQPRGVDDAKSSVVLVVDDDPAVANVARTYLQRELLSVETVAETEATAALERIEADDSIECLVSDFRMPDLDGLELTAAARAHRPDLPVVLFTSVPLQRIEQQLTQTEVDAIVEKDGGSDMFDELTSRVRQVSL